jgi:hypothetical protein
MQPTFNPWLGYFDLIDYVDTFVFFDTVQLNQQSWQTRNKLKINNGEYVFSIPIQKNRSKTELFIKDAMIDFRKFDFREKLLKTLEQNYKKSKYFNEVHPFIKELIFYETNYLSQYSINIITKIVKQLALNTNILILSETQYKDSLHKGDLVLDICKYFNANDYISPLGSKEYLENKKNDFLKNQITLYYQHYYHPQYEQQGNSFIPYMGIFDLLYNCGFDKDKIVCGREYKKG